ncbi:MAG: septum formation initiator family protein [Candidatus Shapirobacteria bacterium]
MIKYIIFFGGIVVIIGLSKDILRLLKVGDEVKIAEQKVFDLKQKNQELKAQLDYYQSDEFVEKEARNKLNLVRPGETIIVLPLDYGGKASSFEHPDPPNYLKWWRLFFE